MNFIIFIVCIISDRGKKIAINVGKTVDDK